MSPQGIVPGLMTDIQAYIDKRKTEYRRLCRQWVFGPFNEYDLPPEHWSPDVCLLVRLPTELVMMVIEDLYQADLAHLAVTCRRMAECTIALLYTRDIACFGCLALRWSCTFGVIPTLERTIRYGAPVNYIFTPEAALGCQCVGFSIPYWTPLLAAIAADEPMAVRTLCAHGADVNAGPDARSGFNFPYPFPSLGFQNCRPVWLYPITVAIGHPDAPYRRPGTLVGNSEIIQCLLEAGADPNQFESWEDRWPTPLFWAMQPHVPVETVKLLLEHGALPHVPRDGNIHYGPWLHNILPLQLLLFPRKTGTHWASTITWEKARLLLAFGGADDGDIKGTPRTGGRVFPTFYSILDFPDIVRLLQLFLSEGADLVRWCQCGISPIQAVIWWAEARSAVGAESLDYWSSHRERLFASLARVPSVIEKMCKLVTLMAEASQAGTGPTILDFPMEISKLLYSPFPRCSTFLTSPLGYVCNPFRYLGSAKLIDVLLNFGADINLAFTDEITPLHFSVMFSTGVAVRLLLEFKGGPNASGLNVNARDSRGWTPLHYACHFGFRTRQTDQVDAVRLLLEHGADIHSRTKAGVSPLLLAIWSSSSLLVELLLGYGGTIEDIGLEPGFGIIPNPLIHHPAIIFEDDFSNMPEAGEHVIGSCLRIHDLFLKAFHPGERRPVCLNAQRPRPATDSEKVSFAADSENEIVVDISKVPADVFLLGMGTSDPVGWPPSCSVSDTFYEFFEEIKEVTIARFSEIKGNTIHSTWRDRLRFKTFELEVYGVDLLSHRLDNLHAKYAPWDRE